MRNYFYVQFHRYSHAQIKNEALRPDFKDIEQIIAL